MTFTESPAFRKDLKRLSGKYKSVKEDVQVLKKILTIRPEASPPHSYEVDRPDVNSRIVNFCKIACKSLKGRGVCSGLNLRYAYFKKERTINFIGLYHETEKKVHADR